MSEKERLKEKKELEEKVIKQPVPVVVPV